jgi:hypothetical protein
MKDSINVLDRALSYCRTTTKTELAQHVAFKYWAQRIAYRCGLLLIQKMEFKKAASPLRYYLFIEMNEGNEKRKVLEIYAGIIENHFTKTLYDNLFGNDYKDFEDDYSSVYVPKTREEDICLCDFLICALSPDEFAKTEEQKTGLMRRSNRVIHRLTRFGALRTTILVCRELFYSTIGNASIYRKLFLSLVSSGWFEEARLAFLQYKNFMEARPERAFEADYFVYLTAIRLCLVYLKKVRSILCFNSV